MGVITQAFMNILLSTWAAGEMAGATQHAFQNVVIPGPFTKLADLVECTFTGYTVGTFTPGAFRYWGPGGDVQGCSAYGYFCAGVTVGNLVYGVYVLGGVHTTTVMLVGNFEAPFPVVDLNPENGFVYNLLAALDNHP